MNAQNEISLIWFKLILKSGKPIDDSTESWSLPMREHQGEILDFSGQQASCCFKHGWKDLPNLYGTWLTSNPKELYAWNKATRIYVAELFSPPVYEYGSMIWVKKVRLVRQATDLELKRFGIYRAIQPIIDNR